MGEEIEIVGRNGDRVRVNVYAVLAQIGKHFCVAGAHQIGVPIGDGQQAVLSIGPPTTGAASE